MPEHAALLALTSMTADGCVPCAQRSAAVLTVGYDADGRGVSADRVNLADDVGDSETDATYTHTTQWSGVIGVEGELTGDGRLIEPNALRWENLPLPLRYVSSDVGAHDGAVVVGRITSITRADGGQILGEGDFDVSSTWGAEAARQVGEGLTNGVSMDLDDVDFELRIAGELMEDDGLLLPMFLASESLDAGEDTEDTPSDEPETDADGRVTVATMNADDEVRVTTSGRIRAATIVAIPAFVNARIELTGEQAEDASLGAGLEAHSAGSTGRVLALDGVGFRPEAQWGTARVHHRGWSESEVQGRGPSALGEYAGSDPTGPDRGPHLPEHTVLQRIQALRAGNGSGEHGAVQPGACFVAVNHLWVWAPIQRTEHAAGDAPTQGWFHVRGADLSSLQVRPRSEPADLGRGVGSDSRVGLTAAVPVDPPAAWFSNPNLREPTAMHYGDDGRVYGHMALWGTCHVGIGQHNGTCTPPPHSASNYQHFHTGALRTAEGSEIAVGHITLDTRHAPGAANAVRAMAHYDHTGMVAADVRVGEDSHGIWVAGALRPDVTPTQMRDLRSAPLSGDWRRIGFALEMVASLCVNVPGYGVPRPSGLVAGGAVVSLVAAGMVAPRKVRRPGTEGALSLDDLRYLKRLADRERAEEAALVASGSLDTASELARRVRASSLAMRVHHPANHRPDRGGQ